MEGRTGMCVCTTRPDPRVPLVSIPSPTGSHPLATPAHYTRHIRSFLYTPSLITFPPTHYVRSHSLHSLAQFLRDVSGEYNVGVANEMSVRGWKV